MGEFRAAGALRFGASGGPRPTLAGFRRSLVGGRDVRAGVDHRTLGLLLGGGGFADLNLAVGIGALKLSYLAIELGRLRLQREMFVGQLLLPFDRLSQPLLGIRQALAPIALLARGRAQPLAIGGGLA